MRYLLLLVSCVAWGQIAFTYGTASGTTESTTAVLSTAGSAYGVVFIAPTATSVSGLAVYASAVGSANVNLLRAQVIEVSSNTAGHIVTYTDASDTVNLTNNPFSNGDVIRFATTTLPAGISLNTDYYVCNRTATTFQIDDSVGCGSVVTDFSGSSGTQYCMKVVSSSTTFSPSPVTAGSWVDFSSFSAHTLVAGRKYAVVMTNTEAVPGTDSITIQYNNGEQPSLVQNLQSGHYGGLIVGSASTSQGLNSTMTTRASGYVTLGSGIKIGSPFNAGQISANRRINGTREVGAKFTTPAGVSMNVDKIGGQISNFFGTTYPTTFTIKLYSVGSSTDTLVDSCETSWFGTGSAGSPSYWCYLSSVRTLSPSTSYRVVFMATGNAGDASNYAAYRAYSYRSGETVDIPWSTAFTYCSSSCTTTANWTNSATDTAAFIIGLDNANPFASSGVLGGGSFVVAQ